MRFLLVALLCALSYAQTAKIPERRNLQSTALDAQLGCTLVSHVFDNPGRYTCDCVPFNDPCLDDLQCIREDRCLNNEVNGQRVTADSCPEQCVEGWVGDNFCDFTDCALCVGFYDGDNWSNDLEDFDDGDCMAAELTTSTTIEPIGLIEGATTCQAATAICESVTFVGNAEMTAYDEGNNYGCLESIYATSWFVFQIENAGDLLMAMQGRDDIDYAIWGPYDSKAEAYGECGSLPAPRACSYSSSNFESITLNSVQAGKIYILVVSDYAASQPDGLPSVIQMSATEGSTATLDCDVVFDSLDECETTVAAQLDFAGATPRRVNLARVNDDNDLEGNYYTNIGTYRAADGSVQNLGLRMNYMGDESDYSCETNDKNGDNLCTQGLVGGFGIINTFRGTVPVKFTYVIDDGSDNGEEPGDDFLIERLRMTILDIDSGFANGEEVQLHNPYRVCPGGLTGEAPFLGWEPNNRLHFLIESNGQNYRWNFVVGCFEKRDNAVAEPTFTIQQTWPASIANPGSNDLNIDKLSEEQLAVMVQAEWRDVTKDGFQMTFVVAQKHTTSRNIWFAGESNQVGKSCCRDVVQCAPGSDYRDGNLQCGHTDDRPCNQNYCCRTTSHGDPIIHTFNHECYDLHKDGNYLASQHDTFDHNVHVAVYNDYMRQISVTKANGDLWLSIDNFGNIVNNDWPYALEQRVVPCPEDYEKDDCQGEYIVTRFDAQDFAYLVQSGLRHNYLDPALKKGEYGTHMDIYPEPYNERFEARRQEYTGLYFHNPLPEELPTCEERA